jgi:hypothetical protein
MNFRSVIIHVRENKRREICIEKPPVDKQNFHSAFQNILRENNSENESIDNSEMVENYFSK